MHIANLNLRIVINHMIVVNNPRLPFLVDLLFEIAIPLITPMNDFNNCHGNTFMLCDICLEIHLNIQEQVDQQETIKKHHLSNRIFMRIFHKAITKLPFINSFP